jgi:hypothetical protein
MIQAAPAISRNWHVPEDGRTSGFELGYFVGRLGRKKVCTLYEEGVSGELIGGSETFGSAKRATIEKHRMISLEVLPRLTE